MGTLERQIEYFEEKRALLKMLVSRKCRREVLKGFLRWKQSGVRKGIKGRSREVEAIKVASVIDRIRFKQLFRAFVAIQMT